MNYNFFSNLFCKISINEMNLGGTVRLNKVGVAIICGTIILFILYMAPRSEESGISKVNLKSLLAVSVELAKQGGLEVVKVKNGANLKEDIKGKTKEGVNIPVTNADYKSHCVMYYGITRNFPTVKVISEEKLDEAECQELSPLSVVDLEKNLEVEKMSDFIVDSELVSVWIDPLDATKEFTEGLYNYVTTMVCIAYKGNPIIGVIHKPFGTEPQTTWVWLNKAVSANLKNWIPKKVDTKTIIISRSHSGNVDKLVRDVFGPDTLIVPAGGAGYKALEVVFGNASGYVHTTEISKWDICAGDAIITGLNGALTSLDGKDLDYSSEASHVNKNGLLAMMFDHNSYLEKLKKKYF